MHDLDDDDPTLTAATVDKIAIRRPDIPVTLGELAALKGDALEIVDARVQILETLRKASIRATHPEDWVLFKARDEDGGQIVGYLEDAGTERVRALWGIRVYHVSHAEKIVGNDPADFMILVSGDGECAITHEIVERMEGGRSSKDDFCRDKSGAALELTVRKAARANLDGGITRELAGMKSVPLPELEAAWIGTPKTIDRCRRGRGFGSHDERVGGRSSKAPDVDPPVCPHCGAAGVYRPAKGDRGAFYGCPNYEKHPQKKFIVDAARWLAQQSAPASSKPATPAPAANGAPAAGVTKATRELTADEVFGKHREPGEEG